MHRYRIAPRFYVFLIAVMLVVFGVSFAVSYSRLQDEIDQLNAAKAEQDALTAEIAALRQEYTDIQTDEYVERIAREELGMLYPGEIRYVGN
ncbi:MAG: septum formation initiator family protein [Clostridia bacterium]|nr:septum formation initiator family protein [Clostridia bacterium]